MIQFSKMSNVFFYILEMFRWIRGTFWTTVLYNTLWAYPRKNTTTRFICSCVMRFDSIFISFHITKGIFYPTKTQFNLLLRNYIHQPFFIPLVTGKITWKKVTDFTLWHYTQLSLLPEGSLYLKSNVLQILAGFP